MIFGPVLGITTHGVRATATAVVSVANSTNCMRPFSVADRWIHSGRQRRVRPLGEGRRRRLELDPKDIYNPGTGWTIPARHRCGADSEGRQQPQQRHRPISFRLDVAGPVA